MNEILNYKQLVLYIYSCYFKVRYGEKTVNNSKTVEQIY